MISVKNLSKKFNEFTAVDQISFEVKKGQIFAFLGPNGAGKTTTIRVLCGLLEPTLGRAKVAGLDLRDGLMPIKRKVGYMSQKFTLYDDLSVIENLEFAGALRKMSREDLRQRMNELFAIIGFDQPVTTLVRDLAGGYKQELSLACALLHNPEIVFLDEPTAGVAPAARARFWTLIRQIADSGKTVFVTTHYMDEAEQCGRIALMRDGHLIALDSPSGLKKSAFPDPLIELESSEGTAPGWIDAVRDLPGVRSIKPYGLRWHASVDSESAAAKFQQRLPPTVTARRIQPSLEDVFIRLVEQGQ
jgi:ABC-2 type transport system ATP-binding protein